MLMQFASSAKGVTFSLDGLYTTPREGGQGRGAGMTSNNAETGRESKDQLSFNLPIWLARLTQPASQGNGLLVPQSIPYRVEGRRLRSSSFTSWARR